MQVLERIWNNNVHKRDFHDKEQLLAIMKVYKRYYGNELAVPYCDVGHNIF